ncbi:4'-phosphopantetheinyl transferase superfamily protein [Streptomyces sp. Go40/10]|uniref:4'-phosphopantetheinyl transferase family protein n=1 Tax=Streptomyces sp. Go40/10 TaxID=2825844 RepID=UPI001E28D7C2|nr:4'-phosphopantetheinyl transferase superfamily protein [Streptomyces sp. Go40/10]UFR05208.1 4'-phosphopantetheinyl transferase superfamily protein [Streptomyces sp. Go40/10]
MIEELLDRPAVGSDGFHAPEHPALLPEEEIASSSMSRERRLKFAAVRTCAREGLRRLGVSTAPILRGPSGEPVWPSGIVGSMTHCTGYHAAAVAPSDEVAAIGIDAEANRPLRYREMLGLITTAEERAWIAEMESAYPEVSWARLVFTAKESVFKAWFSLTRHRLGLGEILVHVNPLSGEFHARTSTPHGSAGDAFPNRLTGRWMARDGLLVAALSIRRSARMHEEV